MAIKTTGQLRQFLCDLLLGIKDGEIEHETARNITRVAKQVNESFYSEAKIAKVRMEAGEQATKLGRLPINVDAPIDGG